MYSRYLGHSTLDTTALSVSCPYVFFFIMMHYASTPLVLGTGGLTSHTCIYGHRGVLSGTARKQVFLKGKETGLSDSRRLGG